MVITVGIINNHMENPQKLTEYQEKEQLVKDINLSIKKMIDIAELIKQSAENLHNENK
jgi:hypothetical protein